jgi:hypothetical protein
MDFHKTDDTKKHYRVHKSTPLDQSDPAYSFIPHFSETQFIVIQQASKRSFALRFTDKTVRISHRQHVLHAWTMLNSFIQQN